MTTYFLKRSKQIWTAASEPFKRDTTTFSSRHMYFGLVAAIGFPLYYVIWQVWFPQPYENLPLRVLGSVIFVPIVFVRLWPEFLKRLFPLYWYLALLFALPFFFTFMLLKNNGSTCNRCVYCDGRRFCCDQQAPMLRRVIGAGYPQF